MSLTIVAGKQSLKKQLFIPALSLSLFRFWNMYKSKTAGLGVRNSRLPLSC